MFGVPRWMSPAAPAGAGRSGPASEVDDFDSIGCILAHCGLEPAWAGSVQPSGELFYLEPGNDLHLADTLLTSQAAHQQAQADKSSQVAAKKKKNLAALQKIMRRKKGSNLVNVNNSADPSTNPKQRITGGKKSPHRTSVQRGTKPDRTVEVTLKVEAKQTLLNTQVDRLESWLGIVHAFDKKANVQNGASRNGHAHSAGEEKHNGRHAPTSSETRVFVRGLIPSGSAMKSGEIELGDIVVSVNSIPVFAETVNSVLASMNSASVFKLQLQRGSLGSWEKYIMPPQRPALNGSLVKLISGERLKEVEDPLRDVCHIISYLTLGREEDEEGKDILYEFPVTRASRKLSDIRGLFITLSDMLQNITDSAITSTSLVISGELVHIAYQKAGTEVLVMAVPASRVPMFLLDCIIKDVVRLLCFLFKNLDSAFQDSNYPRLNHLFSLLFQRLLLKENQQSQRTNSNTFLEGLPGARWLDLPEEVKINIDSSLSELEAADFADMSDDHYDDRRPYVLLGSCFFYKGYVTASHLPLGDLCDVTIYCRNYSLMVLSSQQPVGQLVIWREVYPTRRGEGSEPTVQGYTEPQGRWFLLIIGQGHSLLCLLMEAGGCASRCEGIPAPDPFYVDQARATLLHLESLNIPVACEERLSAPPIPALSCADWFFPSRKTAAESGTPPLPIQSSPMLSKLHSQSPARGRKLLQADSSSRRRSSSPGSMQLSTPSPVPRRHTTSRLDSDNESDTASPYNSRGNSTQSSPIPRRRNGERKGSDVSGGSVSSAELYKVARKKRLIPDPYNMGMMHQNQELECNDYFTATKLTAGCDNTLFHYIHLDAASGIITCPTHGDLSLIGGNTHAQLVQNFNRCCLTIRKLLCRSTRLKARPEESTRPIQSDHCMGYVREYGVMFKCQPENWQEQKKTPPSINYWVVGRLFEEPHPRECYVCYHESATQNVIELAFKLSYGAGL
ncbi:protein inturned-like isoform X2 [Acanthaster planci]|uniref:Protein inturned n=1 Tax=Acanthaster planci TaxID=133434 RepID=A0A8B7XHV0_ACAPL|nr:protein inturned-like isoform X2 [Acanthaster planci]